MKNQISSEIFNNEKEFSAFKKGENHDILKKLFVNDFQ